MGTSQTKPKSSHHPHMSNVLLFDLDTKDCFAVKYVRETDQFHQAEPNTVSLGPGIISVCCRLANVTFVTAYRLTSRAKSAHVFSNIITKAPVAKVFSTYSVQFYITTTNEVVTSDGRTFTKSMFNGGDAYLIGCSSSSATIVTTKGFFCTGSNAYGDIGAGKEHSTKFFEPQLSRELQERDEKIVQIVCGDHNTVLLTDAHKIYVTGYSLSISVQHKASHADIRENHLHAYTRLNIPSRFDHIGCTYYHFCFVTDTGDIWASNGLTSFRSVVGLSTSSTQISGIPVMPSLITCDQVVKGFGNRVLRTYGSPNGVVAITASGEVFVPEVFAVPHATVNYGSGMCTVKHDLIRNILHYGSNMEVSFGGEYCAFYTTQSKSTSYTRKLFAQVQESNPFIDVIILNEV